jgi:hypothetical protein
MFSLFAKRHIQEEPPAGPSPAQARLESIIKQRQRARLRCERDKEYRSFEPYVLFKSARGELFVRGLQLTDPQHPFAQPKIETLKLAEIRAVAADDAHFEEPANFSSRTAEFRYGVICAVDRYQYSVA